MKFSYFKMSMLILLLIFSIFFPMSIIFLFKNEIILIEWEFISCQTNSMIMTMIFDWISMMFLSIVLLISSSVMYFSEFYMMDEKFKWRFCSITLLFVISPSMLIISPNMITILLGWDGLGLVSYILVIYYQNMKSASAGMLTALTNRIGDIAFLLCIGWMLNHGNWNFFSLSFSLDYEIKFWICFLMLLASMTKSAQIPFSAWLPAAMAAPTPISALVHSSTLVTAGVFLLIRFSEYFNSIFWFKSMLLFCASLTMFMASIVANYEYDIKKIIALSTLSQLGLMMIIISLGFLKLAFFHLITHALFKALMFICAGMIIHNFNHFQDIRMMGFVTNQMPIISMCLNSATLALCGMPFMTGFYSKDLILEQSLNMSINIISLIMLFLSSSMTIMYSIRLSYYSFFKFFHSKSFNMMSDNLKLNNSVLMLIFGSIIGGSMLSWLIFEFPMCINLTFFYKTLMLMLMIISSWLIIILNNKNYFLKMFLNMKTNLFMSKMWFFSELSSQSFIFFPLNNSMKLINLLDNGWIENFSTQSMFKNYKILSLLNEILQSNSLKSYLIISLIPMSLIIMLMMIF
uniref:NADH-ubiquinone oxidoreductase chain 5 n=1 Tax=Peripatoides sp. DVL-2010 TaxID=867919 RepID=F8RJ93_9BILA|nr:NADH dehydrogenase subunit 5 [Peripatoides sp. DVL-2010]